MPSTAPPSTPTTETLLITVGQQLRARRKALKVSAITAAESAGMSRVTLHRIEKGEPSVTMGAYMNVMTALGLNFGLHTKPATPQAHPDSADYQPAERALHKGWVPARISLADYPQLKQLAWHVQGLEALTPAEALSIYERNSRHLDLATLQTQERDLIDALRLGYGHHTPTV